MSKPITGWVKTVSVPAPSLENNTADAQRVIAALKPALKSEVVSIDLDLLRTLPELIRTAGPDLRCTLCRRQDHWTLIGLAPADDPVPSTGAAIDLGTSRVVIRLVDLISGNTLAETAFDNPQVAIGPDILTRIHHADQPGGLAALQELIIDGLNREIARL